MATIKPYAGKSVDRLMRLINDTNDTALQEGVDLSLGQPEPITDSGAANTQVLVTFTQEGAKKQYIRYKRLDLASALNTMPSSNFPKVTVEDWPVSTHAYLEAINEALGLDLVVGEVQDIVSDDEGQTTLPLRILDRSSLAWLAGEYDYKIQRIVIDLSNVWRLIQLDGLYPPLAKGG